MKNNNWITFLAGVLIGAGLTWLFTSKEGKEWLQKVKSGGEDVKDDLLKEMEALKQKIQHENKA